MGVLYYRDPTTGTYKPLGGGGSGAQEVHIGPETPFNNEELWFDTNEQGAPPYDWADADARYEPIGSVADHAALADPHPVYATDTDLAGKFPVAGGTMTGPINSFPSAAARNAAITAPVQGMTCYLQDIGQQQLYHSTGWVPCGGFMPGCWVNRNAATAMTSGVKQYLFTVETAYWYGGMSAGASGGSVRTDVAGRYQINGTVSFGGNTIGTLGFGKNIASGVAAWGGAANTTPTSGQNARSQVAMVLSMVPGTDYCLWVSSTVASYNITEAVFSISYLGAFA